MPRPLDAAGLERAAVQHLQRFPCSEARLRFVLNRRIRRTEQPDDEKATLRAALDGVIDKMKRWGYLDDAAYARALVGSLHRRGKGRRAIAAKLRERMVPAAHAEAALEALFDEVSDPEFVAAIRYARRRRLGPFARTPMDADARRRALGSLARQGFGYGVASRVLDADDVEALEAALE